MAIHGGKSRATQSQGLADSVHRIAAAGSGRSRPCSS
jgi:hypothetical protein